MNVFHDSGQKLHLYVPITPSLGEKPDFTGQNVWVCVGVAFAGNRTLARGLAPFRGD